jgi:hypothetical protein
MKTSANNPKKDEKQNGSKIPYRGSEIFYITKFALLTFAAVTMTVSTMSTSFAESGILGLQFEFSLSKKTHFKSVGLTLQNSADYYESEYDIFDDRVNSKMSIPIYTTSSQNPGLSNIFVESALGSRVFQLDSDDPDNEKKKSASAILLSVGLLALVAVGINDDLDKGCSGTEIALSILGGASAEWCHDNSYKYSY